MTLLKQAHDEARSRATRAEREVQAQDKLEAEAKNARSHLADVKKTDRKIIEALKARSARAVATAQRQAKETRRKMEVLAHQLETAATLQEKKDLQIRELEGKLDTTEAQLEAGKAQIGR